MKRSFHQFECEGEQLSGSLDAGLKKTGLLIVSGGNEIRAGAHTGMSRLAQIISDNDFPVFRYDRRGIGDSSGDNGEFLSSASDIAAAARKFCTLCPAVAKIVAFGNCDGATALVLFGACTDINSFILANPWILEPNQNAQSPATAPNAAAIRSRYWERLKNPRSIFDLFSGNIDIAKLAKGLRQAARKQENSGLSMKLRGALLRLTRKTDILIANRDTTALAFMGSWNSRDYKQVRDSQNITLYEHNGASHSFADRESKKWLENRILNHLENS